MVMLCLPIDLIAQEATQRYRIGVCDWMILKRQKLGEFALAREVGADGVEMQPARKTALRYPLWPCLASLPKTC